jgi:hypothetical protein
MKRGCRLGGGEIEVLYTKFNDRFQQIMSSKLVELRREASLKLSKAKDDLAREGDVSASSTARLQNEVNIHLLKQIVSAILESQRELMSSLATPFTDTLATDLKNQMKSYVSPKWCEELCKLKIRGISKQHSARLKEELNVNRSFFLKRAEAQIDLLVDTLRK